MLLMRRSGCAVYIYDDACAGAQTQTHTTVRHQVRTRTECTLSLLPLPRQQARARSEQTGSLYLSLSPPSLSLSRLGADWLSRAARLNESRFAVARALSNLRSFSCDCRGCCFAHCFSIFFFIIEKLRRTFFYLRREKLVRPSMKTQERCTPKKVL